MITKKERFFRDNTAGVETTLINYSGYGYGRHAAGMVELYGYDDNGNQFSYIVTRHRCRVIQKMIKNGEWWTLDSSIRANYSTNGYTTRVGIKRANAARCKQLSDSHKAIYEGGKAAHDMRVALRN